MTLGLERAFQANVAGVVKGFPINKDYYLHRHDWAYGNSWLVTNA